MLRKRSWCPPGGHLKTSVEPGLHPKSSCSQSVGIWRPSGFSNWCHPKLASFHRYPAPNWIAWPGKVHQSVRAIVPSALPQKNQTLRPKHPLSNTAWARLWNSYPPTVQPRPWDLELSAAVVPEQRLTIQNPLQSRCPALVAEKSLCLQAQYHLSWWLSKSAWKIEKGDWWCRWLIWLNKTFVLFINLDFIE